MTHTSENVDSLSCECANEKVSPGGCEYSNNMSWFLTCFWLVSGFWGAAVAHNVVAATVTGSVASWWFSPGDARPVQAAFYRATRVSFG